MLEISWNQVILSPKFKQIRLLSDFKCKIKGI